MSRRRLAIAFGVTACLTLQVGSAHAQASSCVKVLLEYVGKPLAEAFAEKGAGLAAEYFVAKVKQSQQSAARLGCAAMPASRDNRAGRRRARRGASAVGGPCRCCSTTRALRAEEVSLVLVGVPQDENPTRVVDRPYPETGEEALPEQKVALRRANTRDDITNDVVSEPQLSEH